LAVTHGYWQRLPESGQSHLKCPIVDELEPIVQKHQIEGLVMGAA
ncbi:MAG: phytanoyl-CoA dioxygenase, partial [Actinomycetota bacterium]|nr:phytanoyl-CoA dioxygenase [Actinomycetota bacterium]